MDFTICYLEVLDTTINQWVYIPANVNAEPINEWFNNLDAFFDNFNLSFLFSAIEKTKPSPFVKGNNIPQDSSLEIIKAHNFYFEEIKLGKSASYCDLSTLKNFDFNKEIKLTNINEKELEFLYPEINKGKKQTMTHKEWLGEEFFLEWDRLSKRVQRYASSRLIYFIYEIDLI